MWLSDVPMLHGAFSGRPNWTDNYWVHTRVMRLFGDLEGTDDVRQRAGILYRVEPNIGLGRVLVQSNEPARDSDIKRVDLGPFLASLQPGQVVGVRVKANPVRTVNRTIDGRTKTRRERIGPEEVEPWFTRVVEGALQGVRFEDVETSSERQRSSPIAVATIDAIAVVADVEALIGLVSAGVGRAKAFGCGLVSIRPSSSASNRPADTDA